MRRHQLAPIALAALLTSGCAAAKGSFTVIQSKQAVEAARMADAERAEYAWTMAEQYMDKAFEEWGYADYGPAEAYAKVAVEWAQKAEQYAAQAGTVEVLDKAGDIVPETVERKDDTQPDIQGREELLDEDFDEGELP